MGSPSERTFLFYTVCVFPFKILSLIRFIYIEWSDQPPFIVGKPFHNYGKIIVFKPDICFYRQIPLLIVPGEHLRLPRFFYRCPNPGKPLTPAQIWISTIINICLARRIKFLFPARDLDFFDRTSRKMPEKAVFPIWRQGFSKVSVINWQGVVWCGVLAAGQRQRSWACRFQVWPRVGFEAKPEGAEPPMQVKRCVRCANPKGVI